MDVDLAAERAWAVVASGADGPQWYVDAAPLVVRRGIDRLVLGPGHRHPPPGRPLLADGDEVGFWRVLAADHAARRLVLRAEVRAPGTVTLEATVEPDAGDSDAGGSVVSVAVGFTPSGLLGRVYLLADLPARETVIEVVARRLAGDIAGS